MRVLVSWLGTADLEAADRLDRHDIGPAAQAIVSQPFDLVWLLANQDEEQVRRYESWLVGVAPAARVEVALLRLRNPTNFEEIYEVVTNFLDAKLGGVRGKPELTFHLSPGTPAMAAIWVILGKTRYRAKLIQSSRRTGIETVSLPFDISMSRAFFSDVVRRSDLMLARLSMGEVEGPAQFGDIIYQGPAMNRLVGRAKQAALRSVPVLIEGESGTGKELLARAIHQASARSQKSFQVVNCGAIPEDLVESELFGHVRGAFTGAVKDKVGYFEAADNGTLFLDEISELPLPSQVKLLRVLQEGEVRRVGAARTIKVDVRIIAASNRDLSQAVAAGRFREDLFYRLAVLVLKVPPLRERHGDIDPLIDGLLERINDQSESANEPNFRRKQISLDARKTISRQTWPGNVRELENTLRRAAVWSDKETISADDIEEALLPVPSASASDAILNRSIEQGVDLPSLLREVAQHYLRRALERAAGNKSRAAELVGLPSYQTLTNWLRKYGVPEDSGR